jgi:hypothetical protein
MLRPQMEEDQEVHKGIVDALGEGRGKLSFKHFSLSRRS